jgi:probable rRNA maturation factor
MTRLLSLRNRQRVRAVDRGELRRLAIQLLREDFRVEHYELAVHLVAAPEMSRLNETYLRHAGSTDVITFDYSEKAWRVPGSGFRAADPSPPFESRLHGEVFICLDEAMAQARQYGTSWQHELVRYLVHGLLHLRGFDDRRAAARQKMKREENRLMTNLGRRFSFAKLGRAQARRGTTASAP